MHFKFSSGFTKNYKASKIVNVIVLFSNFPFLFPIWMACKYWSKLPLNDVVCIVQITTVDEAKRFYPLFGLGANVALIFSGRTVKYFSNLRKNLGPGVDGWAVSLKGMMSIVVLMGLAICLCYWWVNTFVPLPTRSLKKKVIFCKDSMNPQSNMFVLVARNI